eukprot:m.591768 g.591768  ORF g.591768 m.591768 type:complete len:228 (-) comp22384_c0_seq6:2643-3326(-)
MSRKQLSAEKQRDDANVDDDLSIAKTASDRRTISMQFHKLRQQLLCDADNDYLMRVLTDYAQMRQPERLAVALKAIIDTKEKRALVDMMCETLIPAAHKDIILNTFPVAPTDTDDTILLSFDLVIGSRGIGMCIRGGREVGLGIYISNVDRDGPADMCGLEKGDRIHSINGISTTNASHHEVVELITSSSRLTVEVERCGIVPDDELNAGPNTVGDKSALDDEEEDI